jgi:hypothetical protein
LHIFGGVFRDHFILLAAMAAASIKSPPTPRANEPAAKNCSAVEAMRTGGNQLNLWERRFQCLQVGSTTKRAKERSPGVRARFQG